MLWGLASRHEDFGFFSGKGKKARVLNTDSVAPLSFQWIILAVALRLDPGRGLGSQGRHRQKGCWGHSRRTRPVPRPRRCHDWGETLSLS